jgi:hypothetical protein
MPFGNAAADRMVNEAVTYVLEILPKHPEYARRIALKVAVHTGAVTTFAYPRRLIAAVAVGMVSLMVSGWAALAIDVLYY